MRAAHLITPRIATPLSHNVGSLKTVPKSSRSFATKVNILITRKISKSGFDKIYKDLDVPQQFPESSNMKYHINCWYNEECMPKNKLAQEIENTDALYCTLEDKLDSQVLSKAKRLKIISTMSAGYDHIDVKTCEEREILVGNTPGVLTETTADLTLALILATCRRIPEAVAAAKNGSWTTWKPEWMCGPDLHHSTVGIIGLGRIGQAVARRLSGFGCRILYTARRRLTPSIEGSLGAEYVDLDTLLRTSDFVVPQCPLNDSTRNLFNAQTFGKMKKSAIFINTTRGPVVDQDALYDALKNGTIYAAGLDVTTPEPLPLDHKLHTLSNCVILPHIGSASYATRSEMAVVAANNLLEALNGRPMPFPVVKKNIVIP